MTFFTHVEYGKLLGAVNRMITIIKNLLKKTADPFSSNSTKFLSSANASRNTTAENAKRQKNTPAEYQLHPRLEIREDGDTRVLIDNRNGSITACNLTAWTVLNSLRKGATAEQLTDVLCSKFQVSSDQAKTDISGFFNHLNSMGCLQEVD
jgi:hypothetical protein